MSMFEWKPEYSVEFATIDTQHKRLFQLANNLHIAMSTGKGRDKLSSLLSELIDYTKSHFSDEEALMRTNGYADYAGHKRLHDELTQQVVKFQKEFAAGSSALSVDLMQFLSDWLRHHIMQTDVKVGAFLRKKPVS
jgi:hemerythrin-like metal-binding protein